MEQDRFEITIPPITQEALCKFALGDDETLDEFIQLALDRELRRRMAQKLAARRNRIAARLPELAN